MNLTQFEHALQNYKRMLAEYKNDAPLRDTLVEAVRESLLQRFEYTVEIAWKSVKRYLVEYEGYTKEMGPNRVIRTAGEISLLDPERWILYLAARQQVAHDYSGEKAERILASLDEFLADATALYETLQKNMNEVPRLDD